MHENVVSDIIASALQIGNRKSKISPFLKQLLKNFSLKLGNEKFDSIKAERENYGKIGEIENRGDITIELAKEDRSTKIVIEHKINDRLHEKQLRNYSKTYDGFWVRKIESGFEFFERERGIEFRNRILKK